LLGLGLGNKIGTTALALSNERRNLPLWHLPAFLGPKAWPMGRIVAGPSVERAPVSVSRSTAV